MPTNTEHPDYKPGTRTRLCRPPDAGQRERRNTRATRRTDVNVSGGVIVFIGGLFGFVLIFFVFCFLMGQGDQRRVQEGRRSGEQVAPDGVGSDCRRYAAAEGREPREPEEQRRDGSSRSCSR